MLIIIPPVIDPTKPVQYLPPVRLNDLFIFFILATLGFIVFGGIIAYLLKNRKIKDSLNIRLLTFFAVFAAFPLFDILTRIMRLCIFGTSYLTSGGTYCEYPIWHWWIYFVFMLISLVIILIFSVYNLFFLRSKKTIYLFLLSSIVLIPLFTFILLLNTTPGHFQKVSACSVGYVTDVYAKSYIHYYANKHFPNNCPPVSNNRFLIPFSFLDFYK